MSIELILATGLNPADSAALRHGGREQLEPIRAAIESTGALEYTLALAQTEASLAEGALGAVPDSDFKDALASLPGFAVSRRFQSTYLETAVTTFGV